MRSFADEFHDRYPRCFPKRKLPRVRRKRWKESTRAWWWRTLLPWLWTFVVGAPTTRHPECGASCGEGWRQLLHDLFSELEKLDIDGFRIEQVKQKFCGLRVYTSHDGTEPVDSLIRKAEHVAWRTCELCGTEMPNKGPRFGMNLCDKCEQERER